MADARDFHIADILSVTHDFLISTRHMEAIYDVLHFVTGDNTIMTYQLGRAAKEVTPCLVEQLPQSVRDTFKSADDMGKFIDGAKAKYGDAWHEEVIRILEDEHGQMISIVPVNSYRRDCPIEEAIDTFGADKIAMAKQDPKTGKVQINNLGGKPEIDLSDFT